MCKRCYRSYLGSCEDCRPDPKSPQEIAHEKGDPCEESDCQECCEHSDSRDHGICIDCGHEEDPGEAIDRAQAVGEDR